MINMSQYRGILTSLVTKMGAHSCCRGGGGQAQKIDFSLLSWEEAGLSAYACSHPCGRPWYPMLYLKFIT